MVRGFGSGAVFGAIVSAIGLIAWSEFAPPPAEVLRAQEEATAAEKAAAEAARAAEEEAARAAEAEAAQAAAEEAARIAAEQVAAEQAALAEQHKMDTEKAAEAALPPEVPDEGPQAPEAEGDLAKPETPEASADLPSLAGLDQALNAPKAEADAAPAPSEAPPAAPAPDDALMQPGQPEGQPAPEPLPEIAPAPEVEAGAEAPGALPELAEPVPEALPEASPPATLQDDVPTLPGAAPLEDKLPTSVMDKQVPGVSKGKLPQVGVTQEVPEEQGEVALDPEALPPIQRFARAFEPEGKPLFAILLRDVGDQGMARADLAALPFAVSFVIDPLAPDAEAAAMAYRGAGQEVVMLANGLPQGASAGDVATTFATLERVLPESVAVVDQDLGGFQDERGLATLVLPVIADQGRGLLTYDRGLNAADQIARREGLASAVIFRRLDGAGESRQTIRRYLDRAAFKAGQEGVVVVIGDTRPETVAAILEWSVEGRAAGVSLAPITAVMGQ